MGRASIWAIIDIMSIRPPPSHDQSVGELIHAYGANVDEISGRSDAHQVAGVGAGRPLMGDVQVAFGDLVQDLQLTVGKCLHEHGGAGYPGCTVVRRTRSRCPVHEFKRDQFLRHVQVAAHKAIVQNAVDNPAVAFPGGLCGGRSWLLLHLPSALAGCRHLSVTEA